MEKIEIEEEEVRDPIPGEYGHPIPRELLFRELGFTQPYSRHQVGRRVVSTTLATKAVHTLCTKETVNRRKFKLPAGARTTFHMAFSADGTKLASCHGDHNVYVCDVRNGEILQTLSGHPRTPWCVVFHPTQNDVLASGCLAGHVRVWDLKGGSEVLVTDSGTVIASLAFHPTVRLLAIATFNEIIFWDWGLPHPLARCSTENTKEKVRLVRFDRLGKCLITGITNFPTPPVREGLQTSNSGANHRPNILSRGNPRLPSYRYLVHDRQDIGDNREGPTGIGDIQENRNAEAHPHRDMAEFAESFAAAAEAEAASMVLNRRQDRFQESYRQLVSHYQDLVSHYQQFLRSRIPRLLETSRSVREQPIIPMQNPVVPLSSETPSSSGQSSRAQVQAQSSESANSSSGGNEQPGTSRLMQLEARLLEIINTPENSDASQGPSPPASTTTTTTTTATTAAAAAATTATTTATVNATAGPSNSSIPSRLRNDTDLRNIEVLAQNILEMQNLCSQARRDAPVTHIETQHIIELQNIRSHLELLQEQTRELQSSIRATLTSLARGSLDALRTHVTNASNGAAFSNFSRGTLDSIRSHAENNGSVHAGFFSIPSASSQPSSGGANQGAPRSFSSPASNQQNSSGNPSNAILRITIGPRLTASAELIPPVGPGAAPSISSGGATRTQVPPAISMQYETTGAGLRGSSAGETESTEPLASTSRGTGRGSNDPNIGYLGQRRILREFQFVAGRGSNNEMEQHARNCPFGGRDQSQRPPPRMRCLSEMGETPTLTVWPTIETGLELETRNFREVREPRGRIESRSSTTSSSNSNTNYNNSSSNNNNNNNNTISEPRVASEPSVANPAAVNFSNPLSAAQLAGNYFNQWYAGGPGWISSDVGVHVFLTTHRGSSETVRRNALPSSSTTTTTTTAELSDGTDGENWQRIFPHGFAFIHPSARQGHRPDRRSYRRDPRRPGPYGPARNRQEGYGNNYSRDSNNVWSEMGRSVPNLQSLPSTSSSHLSSTQGTSSSSTSGGGGTASAAANSRNSGRPLPQRLNGNFGLIYYMRAGDEIIPVYAPRSTEFADANEPVALREGPLPNVYVFPIGLFLRGSYWRNGTQTIGIYWPPASRDEEQALSDYRRNDSLVPIHTTSVRQISAIQRSESFNNARYRVAYNSDQMEIFFPQGGSLVLIQPGLLVLDSVTSFADFDRPRADGGTLYLDYLSTFFEALESLFGFRQRNAALSAGGGGGGNNSNSSNSSRSSSQGNWGRHAGIPQQWLENSPFAQGPRIYYDAPDRPDVNGLLSRRNPSDVSFIPMIPAEARVTLERIDRPTIERARRGGIRDEDSTSRPAANSNTTAHTITTSSTGSEGNPTPRAERWGGSGGGRAAQENSNQNDQGNDAMSATRRVIRLAVDTATADILRRDQQTARGHITRAIESRIERVLNERGNRGVPESVPHSVMYLPMASVNVYNNPDYLERQLRLEDIQLRISMLSPWSQQQSRQPSESVTSATQTTASYLQNAPAANPEQTSAASPTTTTTTAAAGNPISEPTPSTSTGGPTSVDPSLRASRRRPFPSPPESQSSVGSVTTPVTSSSYFDDESFPSPSRIPRLTSPLPAHFTHDRPTDPRRVDDRSTNRDWTRGPLDRSGSSSNSGRVSDRRNNDPFSDISNTPVPEFSAARPTNPLLQTMESGTSGDSSSSPPPPVNVSLARTSSYLPAESPEEALRGSLTLTEEERASDLNEFWRNSSRYERSITQEEREPLRERAPGDFEPSFRGLINSNDEFAPVDQPAEPLTLRLRDVLTPVEVSRIEGARRSVIPRVDLDSPDSDDVEVEREAHLVVGAAVPFESSDVLDAGSWGHEGRRGDGPYGGEPIDVNRVGNPVLQRVGEDTARAAIAAMEMMRRESVVPRDDAVAGVEERGFYESEPSGLAGSFPVVGSPGDNLQRQQRRVGSSVPDVSTEVERELSSRERRRGRPLSRMGGSGPSILRTVDEATARNALSASFDLPSAGSATTTMQPSMDSPSTSAATNLSEDNGSSPSGSSSSQRHGQQPPRSRPPMCTQFGEWFLRRQQRSASQYRVRLRNGDPSYHGGSSSSSSSGSQELSGSARTRLGLGGGTGMSSARYSSGSGRGGNSGGSSGGGGGSNRQNSNSAYGVPQYSMYRNAHHFHIHHAMAGNPTNNGDDPGTQQDSGVRFYPGYIPEILITPRTRAQTYYTMDAATTAFLSSRIQKWDFSEFYIPDITDRTSGLITASCSLHSDATLDVSSDSEFIAVLQPSDNGSYSAVGIYSLRDETLGASLYTYHFDQNTVSVSISPSCDYIVVGYAGRGPFYRIVHPSRNIGQILSLTRDREHVKLVPVKELLADTQPTLMSINCMHWVPIPGYGIIYGTNTGEVVLLS